MSRVVNPFDPFGLLSGGPLAMFRAGLDFVQTWQRSMLPLLSLSARSISAFGIASPWKFAGFIPQVDARATPTAAKREAEPTALRADRLSVEAQIAQRQGRESPSLGCMQGVTVVYPEVREVERPAPPPAAPVLDALVSRARVAKPKATVAVKAEPAAKVEPVKAEPAKKAATKPAGVKKAAAKPAGEKKVAAARKAKPKASR